MGKVLVFDLSNLSYIGAHYCGKGIESADHAAEKIKESTLGLMRQLYRQLGPAHVVFACDHQQYWRREIFPEYKGHREDSLLKQKVREAIGLFKQEKAALCVEVEQCEADDVIYAVTQQSDHHVVIISTDGDFHQLLSDKVSIYNPMRKALQSGAEQSEYGLFIKCIRGDRGDNIPSAYPRVGRRALAAAFGNEELTNRLLNVRLKDGSRVGDHYARNRQLIDLSCIPEELKLKLEKALSEVTI